MSLTPLRVAKMLQGGRCQNPSLDKANDGVSLIWFTLIRVQPDLCDPEKRFFTQRSKTNHFMTEKLREMVIADAATCDGQIGRSRRPVNKNMQLELMTKPKATAP